MDKTPIPACCTYFIIIYFLFVHFLWKIVDLPLTTYGSVRLILFHKTRWVNYILGSLDGLVLVIQLLSYRVSYIKKDGQKINLFNELISRNFAT